MKHQDYLASGATWVGTSVKSQKPLSGEELAMALDQAIQQNAASGLVPLSVHPVEAAVRPGVVTTGFVVVWGAQAK